MQVHIRFPADKKSATTGIVWLRRRFDIAKKRLYASFSLSSSASMVFCSSGVSLRMPIPVYPQMVAKITPVQQRVAQGIYIRERRYAQGGRHIGASGYPGQDRLEYGAGILYASTKVAGVQTSADVGRPQQLTRQQEGYLAVAGGGYGQDAGQQGDDNQRAGALADLEQGFHDLVQSPGGRKHPCEGQGTECNQEGAHHALHATPVQQTGNVLGCRAQVEALGEHRGVEPVDDGVECIGDGEVLDDDGIEHSHRGREQHNRNGRLLPRRPDQDDQEGYKQHDHVPGEGLRKRVVHLRDLVKAATTCGLGSTSRHEHDYRYHQQGGEGGPQQVLHMREHIHMGDGRCQVGVSGQKNNLSSK